MAKYENNVNNPQDEEYDDDLLHFEPPEDMVVTEGNTLDDTSDIIPVLLRSNWVEESKQIPLDALPSHERTVVQKCIDREGFNDDELELLQAVLGRYRDAIREQKPNETLERVEENIQLVKDEKQLIQLYEEYESVKTLRVDLPIGDKTVPITLLVTPIENSKAVMDVNNNLELYSDLTEKEQQVYNDIQAGKTLSREDQILADSVQHKVEEIMEREQDNIIIEFLSLQTKLSPESTYESMKELYTRMPFMERTLIFQRVQEMSMLGDVDVNRLFPESRD